MSQHAPPANSSGTPIIEMEHVAVVSSEDPKTPILEEVNWTIAPGDYWAVGGFSSSGKTNLISTASGLLRPLRGVHRLFGIETSRMRAEDFLHERVKIGVVFAEGGRLLSGLSVAENVALPLCYHQNRSLTEVAPQVDAMLRLVDLGDEAGRQATRLPRSLQQRVSLARTLISRPQALLLDNPLFGLDPDQATWWVDFLGRLVRGEEFFGGQPMTMAVATSDLRPWLYQARQFAYLNEQRWRVLGNREAVNNSQEPVLQKMLTGPATH